MSPALYRMSPLKETPEPEQQPLFIPTSTPSTPPTPLRTTLAPAFTMSELLEGVPGLTEDWTSPLCGSFDDSSSSTFSSPSASTPAFSSPSSSPSAASSAPSTPPQQHFVPGLLSSSPAFPDAPASDYALYSSSGSFPLDAGRFEIPELGYPGEPMYPGHSMYSESDVLTMSQIDEALLGMQGKDQEQGQEGMAMFNAFFGNGVAGSFMG